MDLDRSIEIWKIAEFFLIIANFFLHFSAASSSWNQSGHHRQRFSKPQAWGVWKVRGHALPQNFADI
jgi:hypothetical protein